VVICLDKLRNHDGKTYPLQVRLQGLPRNHSPVPSQTKEADEV